MRKILNSIFLILAFVVLEDRVAFAQAGTLDSTFGLNGRFVTPFNMGNQNAAALQQNGKIVVGGFIDDTLGNHSAITRFNYNGTIDSTFGANGYIKFDYTSHPVFSEILSISIQPDGKIVSAGMADTGSGNVAVFALARYNANGSFDNSFGQNGTLISYLNSNQPAALALQPDGKILVTGGNRLVRYNSDGTFDNSFGINGIDTSLSSFYYRRAIALQTDLKICVAGSIYTTNNHHYSPTIVRFNSNGSLDNTFGNNGIVTIQIPYTISGDDYGQSISIQGDGKIIISDSRGVLLIRLNPDGSFDNNFAINGVALDTSSPISSGANVKIQSDGKIIKSGTNLIYYYFPVIKRFNIDGTIDPTFGNHGAYYPPLAYYWDRGDFLLIQPDDKVLFGGWTYGSSGGTHIGIRRLKSDAPIAGQPYILLSSGSLNSGQSVAISGYHFTPNGSANVVINGPASFQQTFSANNTLYGTFISAFQTDSSMPSGQYTVNAVDSATGIYAPVKSFVLTGALTYAHLEVLAPETSDTLFLNDTSQITWTDKLILGQNYSINGAQRNYKYTIEISDNNGSSWQVYTTVQGWGYINAIKTFHVPIAFGNAGNGYYVRVTDFYKSVNTDNNGPFSVITPVANSNNIKAELYWDFSYNNQSNALFGVAADGAARIYLVVSKINSGVGMPISNVSVQISDQNNTSPTTLGKVMAASQVSGYDNEANAANSLSATQSTEAFSRFWFWYVAPDDFKGNNTSDDLAAFRYVKAHFTITYSDNSTETIDRNIKIVRPPLCFVHGLGSDPSAWNDFRHTAFGYELNFLNDGRFYTKRAIQIDPKASFNVNAQYLTIGFNNQSSLIFQNSLQGVIKDLRNQGYAANRCDYVGHSMGGCVLRYALDHYNDYFYRTGVASNSDYKNYGKGYVNKVVTINTPHNSSPWADILHRYTPDLTVSERLAIQLDYGQNPNSLPFSFITQDDPNLLLPTFITTDAVRDLQIDEGQGGVNFSNSNVRAHLIGSDFFPGITTSTNNLIPQGVINIVDQYADDVDFLNRFLELTIAEEQDQQLVSDLVEISDQYTNPIQSALQYIERMADLYNTLVFIPESDLVVGVSSQLADNPRTAPNVTVFDDYIGHAFIRPILGDVDAGDKVNELLNTPITSNEFAGINATSNMLAPNYNNSRSTIVLASVRDTSKLKILSPASHSNLTTDNIVDVKISLADTAHLISLKVKFQNKTYKLSKTPGIIDLNTQVNSNLLDSNYIFTEAFYKYPDTSLFIYDTVMVNVTTTSSLIGFSAKQEIIYLNINQTKIPDYVSYYQGFATSVSTFSRFITATVDNGSILSFDPQLKGFKGLTTGETYAVVSYKGLSDTIYFVVGENPLDSISTGIQEVYNTPAIAEELKLLCYPNPFNQQMKIDFEVANTGDASLKVFDVMGNEVVSLLEGKREKGVYQTYLDGAKLMNGIYFCELRNGNMKLIRRIVALK